MKIGLNLKKKTNYFLSPLFVPFEIEEAIFRMRVSADYQQQLNIGAMHDLLRHFRYLDDGDDSNGDGDGGGDCDGLGHGHSN